MPKLNPDELDTHGIKVSAQDDRKLKKWMGWNWEPAKRDTSSSAGAEQSSFGAEKRKALIFLIVVLCLVMLLIGLNLGSLL